MEIKHREFNLDHVNFDLKDAFKLGIESTIDLASKDVMELKTITMKPLKTALHLTNLNLCINLWNGDDQTVKTSESLEKALKLAPNQRLAGFKIKDQMWPIQKPDSLVKDCELVILNEVDLSNLYVACGGDEKKIKEMFKTSN
jgi:hypothetical protein